MFNHPAFKRLPKKLTISFPLWIIYATKGEYSPYYDIDKLMVEYAKQYPDYGFEKHKGYGTAQHIKVIKEKGPCELHRRSFIKNFWAE